MYVTKYTFKNPFQFLENYLFMKNTRQPPCVCCQIEKMLVIPYNSPYHCVLANFAMFLAKDIAHLVYQFQSFLFDAAWYL